MMRTRIDRVAVWALVFFMHGSVRSQTWEVFDISTTGLPSNTVRAVAHDGAGNTWVGTDWGLCKYDGSTWEVFQMANSGLPDNDIRALACDDSGRIWIGTFSMGLVLWNGTEWSQYTPSNSPMPSDEVRNITLDPQGNAWLATTNGMVWTDLNEWRVYTNTDESYNGLIMPGTNIADIAVRSDGLVCVGTLNAGFTYVTQNEVIVYTTSQDGLPDNTALGVAVSANGDRWLACPSGGLLRNFGDIQGGFWAQYISQSSAIPSNALNDVVIDALDRKIIATQIAGVGILTGTDQWQTLNMANSGLPDDDVLCVSVAPDGAIWAGTATGGAARYDLQMDVPGPTSERAVVLSIHPVPANATVLIDGLPEGGAAFWSLWGSLGNLVDQGTWSGEGSKSLDISGYTPGPYVLKVIAGHTSMHGRLIKQ